MNKYNKKTTETYWNMMGVAEFDHILDAIGTTYGRPTYKCIHCGFVHDDYMSELSKTERCTYPDPIPLSLAELAEYMRNACDRECLPWTAELHSVMGHEFPITLWSADQALWKATPKQRIEAAVAAWEYKND